MLPFTMKDHLEMYTNAQAKAGLTNEKFMNQEKISALKNTNRTVKLPQLPTSGDASNNVSHHFENSDSRPTMQNNFSRKIDVSISASASSRATKVVSMPSSPIQKDEKKAEELKATEAARVKYNHTESSKAPVMDEYHMNLSKIHSSEDLIKIDFNAGQQYIARQARESEKLIQRVEQYQDMRATKNASTSSVAKKSPSGENRAAEQALRNTMKETVGSQNTINIISASGQQNIINIDELSPASKTRQLSSTMKQPIKTQLIKPQKVVTTTAENNSQKSVKFNSISFGQSAQAHKSNNG